MRRKNLKQSKDSVLVNKRERKKMDVLRESYYGKCSKISNTFLFLFSNKTLVIRTGINRMLVGIPKQEIP